MADDINKTNQPDHKPASSTAESQPVESNRSFWARNTNRIGYTSALLLTIATTATVAYNLTHEVNWHSWFILWKFVMSFFFITAIPLAIFFITAGLIDLKNLFKTLNKEILNEKDDGIIRKMPCNQNEEAAD